MKNLRTKILAAVNAAMVMALVGPIRAFASDDVNWIKSGSSGSSTLTDLNHTAQGYFADTYTLLVTIGGGCAVIFGIGAAVKLMSTDARKRNEGKDALLYVLIGAALVSGMVAIIGIAMGIGSSFAK